MLESGMMTNDAECLATISWDELVIGDILKYNLKPGKGTGDEEEHYEIILSVSRDFAKTLNTKRTDKNKFARDLFSAAAAGRAVLIPEGKFFILRDDETYRPLVDSEDLARWDLAREEEIQQTKKNAQNLLDNLEKLAKIQERVNPLTADDGVPFEQLMEEWGLCGITGQAGRVVTHRWHSIYGKRFVQEYKARHPAPETDPAFDRG